jgi:hypothetical protein
MINERPGTWVPFDEEKLRLVREFLRREFRGGQYRDYFEFDTTAQVFLVETAQGLRHTLAISKGTFEDTGFILQLNKQLVAALKLAGSLRVTLAPHGPKALPGKSNTMECDLMEGKRDSGWEKREQFERPLERRHETDRARAFLDRRSLAYGAVYGPLMLLLGIGACELISSLAGEVRDQRQRVSEWRFAPEQRNAAPSTQSQSTVPTSPVSATVVERARSEARPAVAVRRIASTERPTPRPQDRRDRNLSPSVAASAVDSVDTLRRLVGYIPEMQPGKAIVRWVKAQPLPDPEAQRREPEIPQAN